MKPRRRHWIISVLGCGTLASLAFFLAVGPNAGCMGSREHSPRVTPAPAQLLLARATAAGVFWRDDDTDEVGKELSVDADPPVYLSPGRSWVRCDGGGRVMVYHPSGEKEYTSTKWEQIPYITDRLQRELADRLRQIVFRPGGMERAPGGEPTLYSPSAGHLARPKSFVFRWEPLPPGTAATLLVVDRLTADQLWSKSVDGAAGSLDDAEARTALDRWRHQSLAAAEIDLRRLSVGLRAGGKVVAEATFGLIPSDCERALEAEIKLWEDDAVSSGVVRHLGLSATFHGYDLPVEACDAAVEAVRLSPNDPLVRRNALRAARFIGDHHRARQLGSLPAGRDAEPGGIR